MRIIENRLSQNEEGILRKRDELYISHRKRVYLYWFKFLQESERSPDLVVNWNKYRGWGGSNVVLGQKFDEWWEDQWKDLFAVQRLNDKPKFNPTGKVNLENIRLSYLVYMFRDTPIDYIQKQKVRYHGRKMGGKTKVVTNPKSSTNKLSIAYRLYKAEISKKRFTRVALLNPDDDSIPPEAIQARVRGLLRKSKDTMQNVCQAMFP